MSESPHTASNQESPLEDQANNSRETQSQSGRKTEPELQLTIVRYDDRPDRGTIHPPDLSGIERMETWISVDLSVVSDLSLWQ